MSVVFIAGSIKIKHLDPRFIERIKNVVSEGHSVIVGDAEGADTSIQKELAKLEANVVVYCSGQTPRNNIGKWRVNPVCSEAAEGTRSFFSAKDRQMAKDADFGLMMWDSASTGTLSNVVELAKGGKKCVVFVNKQKKFVNIKDPKDVLPLVDVMSDGARVKAEQKIGLRNKLAELVNLQSSFSL